MTKRAFIVHGWDGHPDDGWFPWLKRELEKNGFAAAVPAMPEPSRPIIRAWVDFLSSEIGAPDAETHLIGHSIGAQAILRYLESLTAGARIGSAVFVAGWVTLTREAYETPGEEDIARPWIETPIAWQKVKSHAGKFAAIFSDTDPFVPMRDADVFARQLDAEIVVEHGRGHLSGSDGVTELPAALLAILRYAEPR